MCRSHYPGSKWKLSSEIISCFPKHHSYLEPFFGSGAVLFRKEKSNIETINDIDNNVTNLFECIKEDPEKLSRMLYLTPYSKKVYDEAYIRYLHNTEEAFCKALTFLIVCNMSHGFRCDNNKVGFKIDVQGRERSYTLKTWNNIPNNLELVANRLKEVQIENCRAENLIKRFNYSNVLMYLDPPYMLSERFGKQYKKELDDEEHEELLSLITSSKAKILLSGYDNSLYKSYLKDWSRKVLVAHSQNHSKKKEIIWSNFELNEEKQLMMF